MHIYIYMHICLCVCVCVCVCEVYFPLHLSLKTRKFLREPPSASSLVSILSEPPLEGSEAIDLGFPFVPFLPGAVPYLKEMSRNFIRDAKMSRFLIW
jgi:hypothetical protein